MKQVVCCLALATLLTGCGGSSASTASSAPPPIRLTSSDAPDDQIRFVAGYSQGLLAAQSAQKPILVFFTAEWCRFCRRMAQEAFAQPQVVQLSQQFVCVVVDADVEPDVCRKFRVEYYPTVQFLSHRGVALNRVVGQQPGDEVLLAMQAALESLARRPRASEQRPL